MYACMACFNISEVKLRKVYRYSEMFADRKLQILRVLADHSIKAIDDSFSPLENNRDSDQAITINKLK